MIPRYANGHTHSEHDRALVFVGCAEAETEDRAELAPVDRALAALQCHISGAVHTSGLHNVLWRIGILGIAWLLLITRHTTTTILSGETVNREWWIQKRDVHGSFSQTGGVVNPGRDVVDGVNFAVVLVWYMRYPVRPPRTALGNSGVVGRDTV